MAKETPLLRISLDGKLALEASITVHDQTAAWSAFLEAFPAISNLIVGELFLSVRSACDDELLARAGPQGITIDLQTHPGPRLVIPQTNGQLPPPPGGF